MKLTRSKPFVLSLAIALGLIAGPSAARANFIVNGSFTSGPDGLSSWTVSDPGFVTAAGGAATIREDFNTFEVGLYQTFTFPSPNTTSSISFRLVSVTTDTVNPGELPPAFGVSLLDPVTGAPLVSTVNSTTDSYYIRDLSQGVASGQAASGVTVSSGSGLPTTITIDTSGLTGNAELLFRVITAGLDFSRPLSDYQASVTIDSVSGSGGSGGGGTSVVPAPPSIVLFGMGGLALAANIWRSRRARQGRC